MLQEIQIDSQETQPEPEPEAPQQSKAAALTGAFVQRGRDRAPRVQELRGPALLETDAESSLAVPSAPAPTPKEAQPPARHASRWTDVLFVAACCAAFFATFLFVLRF